MFDTKTRFRTLTRREEEIELGTWKRNEREKKYDSRDIEVSSICYRISLTNISDIEHETQKFIIRSFPIL